MGYISEHRTSAETGLEAYKGTFDCLFQIYRYPVQRSGVPVEPSCVLLNAIDLYVLNSCFTSCDYENCLPTVRDWFKSDIVYPFSPTLSSTARHEGLRGYFKGLVPHSLRVAPSAALTFLVYEECLKFLKKV